jgi:hypothetical protein
MVGTFQWSGAAEDLLWSYGLSGLGLGFQLELEELEWKLLLWDPLLLPRQQRCSLARSASEGLPLLALRASVRNFLAGVICELLELENRPEE